MTRARSLRVILALLATLVLSGLSLVFLSSGEEPAPPNLPPFEKELYLSVTAKWAPNDCVDVTVVTNLPEGTIVAIGAQPRIKREKLEATWPVDQVFTWTDQRPVIVGAPRTDARNLFCGMVKSRGEGNWWYTNGLLLEAAVSARSFGGLSYKTHAERQELRVGHNGALLKGHLTRALPGVPDRSPNVSAKSETFILKPLPLLPGEDEKRKPVGATQ